jgi:predicted nucleotidyltransferase
MRLKKDIVEYLKILAFQIFNSKDIWLFGSRVDDNLKGGDIDLYLETEKKDILILKINFLREFEKKFGEQKVDLIVNNFSKEKEIFKIAKESGKKL